MLRLKNFGAVGDGVTDDTASINSWIAACDSSKEKGYVDRGEFMHTGFTIPRDVTIDGDSREHSVFKMMPGILDTPNIILAGPQIHLSNFTVNGNGLTGGTSGNGIDHDSSGSYFNLLEHIRVEYINGIGLNIREAHNGCVRSCSFDRCSKGVVITHCIGLNIDTCDIARFTESGIVVQGNPSATVVNMTTLYMESGVQETVNLAPFIKFSSLREKDVVTINNVYMFGHTLTKGHSFSGIEIETPISMDKVVVSNVQMKDMAQSMVFNGVADDTRIRDIQVTGLSLVDGTPDIPRRVGVITDNSREFNMNFPELDLSGEFNTVTSSIMAQGPFKIKSITEMISESTSGIGGSEVNVGTENDEDLFGSISPATDTPVNTLTDKESELTSKISPSGASRLILTSTLTSGTIGKAVYNVRGIIY